MTEDYEIAGHMYYLPTEILQNIFIYLPAKDLTRCRAVSPRWKLIIDDFITNHDMWERNCKDDFRSIYQVARKKAKPGLLWYNLYRSLALWRLLEDATEDRDEFAAATRSAQEIRNFEVLDEGIIGVHKKSSIVYYDIETLAVSHRQPITGDYSRYSENENVIVVMSYNLHLFIIRKVVNSFDEENNVTFHNVKMFTLTKHELFFVNLNDEIFVCNLHSKTLPANYLSKTEDGIMSIGYSNGYLNILTFKREIFSIVKKNIVLRCSLGPDDNLLHQLKKFDFLDHLDWPVYFQWMYVLNHSIPEGPLRDIIIIRPYGDVYFVGSHWGVLRIYYAPYSAGEFDIFNTKPMKQYNFMEKSDCTVLCMCPILQVDVLEGNDGHTVLVAMPKKVAVLNFTHNSEETELLAMLSAQGTAVNRITAS